ncbi:MAG: cytochrome d ubiquinol oxidase subunit II [Alphaproteobacteria bacterium]|jgi:cytochrome d ubiquinol oxidase subunit II|nr:cytochrome d ubiquinol oxidase subunit II [Alphaproteobacteria bacterium]
MLDYEILRVIWWLLLGTLLIGYAIMDGFDLGVSTLLPFIAKTETEKRVLINTIEPYWEGNQIWLVLGGGAIFAAWPAIYAVSFSGLYLALCLVLVALILRPVSFAFRNKYEDTKWKGFWTWTHFVSGFLPALLTGVAVGNVIIGLPFKIDPFDLSITYHGNFFQLLNPFALLCGLVSLSMIIMQGSIYTAMKTEDALHERSKVIAKYAGLLLLALYAVGALFTAFLVKGYIITSEVIANAPSNPMYKTVEQGVGVWFHNFVDMPWTLLAPALVILGVVLVLRFIKLDKMFCALIASSTAIFGVVATAGVIMFPFILPSSYDLTSSLTVWDASSSQLTLQIMLIVTIIFLPIVLLYTAWVFRVLRGKVKPSSIEEEY